MTNTNNDNTTLIWNNFVKYGKLDEQTPRIILQSWQRCIDYLDPKTRLTQRYEYRINELIENNSEMISLFEMVFNRLENLTNNNVYAILLSDANGTTLKINGADNMLAEMAKLGFKSGALWREDLVGTNAINLCMEERSIVTTNSAQNFHTALHDYNLTAHPVITPDGKFCAVITYIIHSTTATVATELALLSTLVDQFHALYAVDQLSSKSIYQLNEQKIILNSVSDGIIISDYDNKVLFLNHKFKTFFKLEDKPVLGQNLTNIIRWPPLIHENITSQTSMFRASITVECGNEFFEICISLSHSLDNKFMLFLHESQTISANENRVLCHDIKLSFDHLIAQSTQTQKTITTAKLIAKNDGPLYIHGEEGVGKRSFALAIHNSSTRRDGPFVSVNLHALAPKDITKELLGSDDLPGQPSKFELAHGGTLYIERVNLLTGSAQAALTHIVKTGTVMRLNSHRVIPIDTRLITSSMDALLPLIEQHRFCPSLYYTITNNTLELTALATRQADTKALIQRKLIELSKRYAVNITMNAEAITNLVRHDWLGNISELHSSLENIVLNRSQNIITTSDLPLGFIQSVDSEYNSKIQIPKLETSEKLAIEYAWNALDGKIIQVAKALGISRTTLWRKLKKYNIAEPEE